MKRSAFLLAVLLCCSVSDSSDFPKRPEITGIAYARIHTANLDASASFFSKELGFHAVRHCKGNTLVCVAINDRQSVRLGSETVPSRTNLVEEVGFMTSDLAAMRKYLIGMGLKPTRIKNQQEPTSATVLSICVADPEGHNVAFVEGRTGAYYLDYDPRVSKGIIHAGFVVNDREAADHFYRDILGFRRYWHGGMKDDETDWVDMQVPDGTDWIEYMLNVPADADKRELGVMNHIALGVPDIHAAEKQLLKNGAQLTEKPEIGRDGKWQLNLYDPDFTRVEFMEFTPVQKPCCSDFTGPHPKP